MLRRIVRVIVAVSMIAIGIAHFVIPAGFVAIVPAWLPAPEALVAISGFFEIVGGLGLLVRRVRRAASYGLVALYVAVFPANINMAVHDLRPEGIHVSAFWARLPFQIVFIALALWVGREGREGREDRTGRAAG
jgi:uncharacterized membrane protein